MMIASKIDLLASVRVDEYTSKYMSFLHVSDKYTEIIFYTRKSDGNWLNDYVSLQGKTIGTTHGFSYFDKFDHDESLKKFKTNNTKQLSILLEAGRVDAYITYTGIVSIAEGYFKIIKALYSISVKPAVWQLARVQRCKLTELYALILVWCH
jgi:ABC-type amino acid transport substrate-binding protein